MHELCVKPGPIIVLAPHPDDEALGCGRLLSTLWTAGRAVHLVCLTDGGASHPGSRTHPRAHLAALRKDQMRSAVLILGGSTSDLQFLNLPDATLHRILRRDDSLVSRIARLVEEIGAVTLIAPSALDPHCDHEAAADAALRVAAHRKGLRLLFYPIWSRWTSPGHIAPIPPGMQALVWTKGDARQKRAAIDAHASQQGRVIHDDPAGFAMPPGFASFFAQAPEIYFELLP